MLSQGLPSLRVIIRRQWGLVSKALDRDLKDLGSLPNFTMDLLSSLEQVISLPCASHFTALCLRFSTCNMGIMTVTQHAIHKS